MKTMKPIYRHKRNQRRLLAPWRRGAADLEGLKPGGEIEERLAALKGRPAIYHCVSRVVDRRRVLGAEEKEQFVRYMREYEEFCMIRILTHCVMSNHFHILVEIPEAPEDRGKSWSDEKFLGHISCLYHDEKFDSIAWELGDLRRHGDDEAAEAYRDKFFARMWDLASFMHDLKMRFTKWYNWREGRDGCLWSQKFRSVLVEGGLAAQTVAAYIDLNPVRAGMVEDPKDYRWSGYGEAVAGLRRAREGLRLLVFGYEKAWRCDENAAKAGAVPWRKIAAAYRRCLYTEGGESELDEKKGRKGISRAEVAAVLAGKGRLSAAQLLQCRVRHFTEGMAIGGEGFIEGVFTLARDRFGAGRRTGARKIRRAETELRSLRDLGKDALSI
jgi:REP element-mobilizing transposase RayT